MSGAAHTIAQHARRLGIWLIAIGVATALHASVLAWVILEAPPVEIEEEADGSAMPIDITAITAAASPDVAAKTGMPTPEVAPQQPTPAEASEEPPPPTEKNDLVMEQKSIAETDVSLPRPAPEKVESEVETIEEKPPTPPEPQQVTATAEQEAAAPPPAVAPPAFVSPSVGLTPSQRLSKSTWERALVAHLDKFKRYPEQARRQLSSGDALVEFSMDRNGAVLSHRLLKSSGSSLLDGEAEAILERATPLPVPPREVVGDLFNMIVPIRFRLR